MNVANRTRQSSASFTGVVNTILAIFLILTLLGICNSWCGTTGGLFVGLLGGAMAGAVCAVLILLINIRDVLEESRSIETDSSRQGKTLVDAKAKIRP